MSKIMAHDVGPVFGIELDDETSSNIHLAATSASGLQNVGRARDGLPARRKIGGPGSREMSVNPSADRGMS